MVFQRRRTQMGFVRPKRARAMRSRARRSAARRRVKPPSQLRRAKLTKPVRQIQTPQQLHRNTVATIAPPRTQIQPTVTQRQRVKVPTPRRIVRATLQPQQAPVKPQPKQTPVKPQTNNVRPRRVQRRARRVTRSRPTLATIQKRAANLRQAHSPMPSKPVLLPPVDKLEAYCINLDRRPDRWKSIQASWEKHVGPLANLHRVSAVDTGDLKGCGLSHQKIIRQAKTDGKPYVLVVEGDALFYANFKKTYESVRQTLKTQNPPWDIVLGGVHFFSGGQRAYPPNLAAIGDFSATHCVLYRNTCYDVVLGWTPELRHIDRFLGRSIRHKLAVSPFLSYTSNGYSEIRRRNVNDMSLYDKHQTNLRRVIAGHNRRAQSRRH